jgi:DNA-binding SARP family transcriptional activator
MTDWATGPLRVELLGPVRAWRAGQELDLGPARRRAVFAMLAANASHVVSRDTLVEGIWGSAAPTAVDSSLYTYVSALRRSLDPARARRSADEVLVSAGSGYSLRLKPEHVDVDRFHQLRETAQRCWTARDYGGALVAVDSALALWRGDALSGISGPFADGQRARLTELRLVTLARRAEVQLALGGQTDVVAELTDLVRHHPLREGLRRLLMLALYQSGQRSRALDVYQETRRVLVDRLGIEPGPELRQLHQQLLVDDPTLRGSSHADSPMRLDRSRVAGFSTPVRLPPRHFVGRGSEVARLRGRLDDLAHGRGSVIWVDGDPGIGKSAFLTTGLTEYVGHGARVLWGNGDPVTRRFPLRLLAETLGVDQRFRGPQRIGPATVAEDSAAVPGAVELIDPLSGPIDDMLALVREMSADVPLVLVMDDAQWADEASLLVWHRLCSATEWLPLLLVGVARTVPHRAELDRLRAEVGSRDGELFELGPLHDAEVGELVERVLEARPEPGLRAICTLAAGNPLYVQQLIDTLILDGLLDTSDGMADVVDGSLEAPWSTDTAVIGGLDFLTSATKEMLRAAAPVGLEFDLTAVAALLGKKPSDLVDVVEEAVAAGVLTDAGNHFAFRHPVVWRALFHSIPGAVSEVLRRQAALSRIPSPNFGDQRLDDVRPARMSVSACLRHWLELNVDSRMPTTVPHREARVPG